MSEVSKDRFDTAPISALLDWQVLPGESGEATIVWNVDQRMHNPMKRMHGGAIAAMADAVMGIAFGRTLDDGQDFATIDLHVQFMRPVVAGTLRATAKVSQRGLRVGFVTCEISDHKKRLIATGSCSCIAGDSKITTQ